MEIIKIYNHTVDDKGTVSNTDNISSITDKLIRLAAKLTERFAGDIIYDIDNLIDAVDNGIEYDSLLFFRENGVTTMETKTFDASVYDTIFFNFTPIQIWHLTHNPSKRETRLIRVNIHKDYTWR